MCVWLLEYMLCCSSGYVEIQFMEPDFDHQKWSNKLQVISKPAEFAPNVLCVVLPNCRDIRRLSIFRTGIVLLSGRNPSMRPIRQAQQMMHTK